MILTSEGFCQPQCITVHFIIIMAFQRMSKRLSLCPRFLIPEPLYTDEGGGWAGIWKEPWEKSCYTF